MTTGTLNAEARRAREGFLDFGTRRGPRRGIRGTKNVLRARKNKGVPSLRSLRHSLRASRMTSEPVRDEARGWLLFGDEELAIFHALHGLKLDFGFLVVGDVGPGLRNNDERLRAVGQVEGALELQRL